jgi:hypothetical protein
MPPTPSEQTPVPTYITIENAHQSLRDQVSELERGGSNIVPGVRLVDSPQGEGQIAQFNLGTQNTPATLAAKMYKTLGIASFEDMNAQGFLSEDQATGRTGPNQVLAQLIIETMYPAIQGEAENRGISVSGADGDAFVRRVMAELSSLPQFLAVPGNRISLTRPPGASRTQAREVILSSKVPADAALTIRVASRRDTE